MVRTVQATLPAGGPQACPPEVAWVVVRAAQSRGYAKEAARSLVAALQEAGWTVVAHIHPPSSGLAATTDVRDGQVRWAGMPTLPSPGGFAPRRRPILPVL